MHAAYKVRRLILTYLCHFHFESNSVGLGDVSRVLSLWPWPPGTDSEQSSTNPFDNATFFLQSVLVFKDEQESSTRDNSLLCDP